MGRLALTTASGPGVLPVNYVVLDGAIVFRTAPDTLGAAHIDDDVGFEVDRIDEAMSEGWSVLAVGRARRVAEPEEVERIRQQSRLRSWGGGERERYVRNGECDESLKQDRGDTMGIDVGEKHEQRQPLVRLARPQRGVAAMRGDFAGTTPIRGVVDTSDVGSATASAAGRQAGRPPAR